MIFNNQKVVLSFVSEKKYGDLESARFSQEGMRFEAYGSSTQTVFHKQSAVSVLQKQVWLVSNTKISPFKNY